MPHSDTSVGDSTTNKALEIVSITATDESTATMKSGLQLKRLTSLRNDVDVTTLDYCQRNKKDDWYLQALKVYYFPFLLKNHNYICIVWLCVFIISLVFGPALLSLTRTNLDVPAGTPTATALSVFKSHFPAFSTYVIASSIIFTSLALIRGTSLISFLTLSSETYFT